MTLQGFVAMSVAALAGLSGIAAGALALVNDRPMPMTLAVILAPVDDIAGMPGIVPVEAPPPLAPPAPDKAAHAPHRAHGSAAMRRPEMRKVLYRR